MIRTTLLAALLGFALPSPALAQETIATRLEKARAEVNTTENAAKRAQAACQRGELAKCGTEARTTANAASRALYAIDRARELAAPAPTPSPSPTPTPSPAPQLSGTLSEGDSISVTWSGNHTGIYAAAHPGERFIAKAIGGSTVETMSARFEASAAERPKRVTILIGANGIGPDFLPKLSAYAARWKATGAEVFLSTTLPQCSPAFNALRPATDAGIRALGYPVIDYAADPVIGPDAAGCDKVLFGDGTHPTDAGQQRMALVYSAKLDGKPAPAAPIAAAPTFPAPFDIAKGLQRTWGAGTIPGIYNAYEGAFRFICGGDGKLASDDPLLYPNRPGAAHLHLQWGSADFSAATTPSSLQLEPATNCNATPFSLNRSQYWMPALLNDQGQVIRPDSILVYYKRKTASSPFCTPGTREFMGICIGLPNQIRFIFGWDVNRPNAPPPPGSAQWACTGAPGQFPDLDAVFTAGCKPGDTLIAMTLAPNCTDGRLDSADHRSHMAYTAYGEDGRPRCPATHQFLIPQEENKAQFTVTADMLGTGANGSKVSRIRLSSDDMVIGAKPGSTLHADYMEAWVEKVKQIWLDNCIDKGLDCSGGDLGNGQQLIGASQPAYGWTMPNPRVAMPAAPHH